MNLATRVTKPATDVKPDQPAADTGPTEPAADAVSPQQPAADAGSQPSGGGVLGAVGRALMKGATGQSDTKTEPTAPLPTDRP